MLKNKSILVLGGDRRSREIACFLAGSGYDVLEAGLGEEPIDDCKKIISREIELAHCSCIILPTPAFVNGNVFSPLDMSFEMPMNDFWISLPQSTRVFGGRFPAIIPDIAVQEKIEVVDYMKLDEVLIYNAAITAEGAISLAMQALDTTLDGATVAVLGYGRIGEALVRYLQAIGASVTVAVRKIRDISRLHCIHVQTCRICEEQEDFGLDGLSHGFDVIFNTIPARVLSEKVVRNMSKDTLLIELASAPGGWDPAVRSVCRQIFAPGLPGKYAPRRAGEVIAKAILPMLEQAFN